MRHLSVEIRRNELTTIRQLTTPWELNLMRMVHGPANVAVKGEIDSEMAYPTSAKSEYARLEQVYGSDKEDDGRSFVAKAYGDGQGGHINLGNAIRAAIADAKTRPAKAPPPDEVAQDPEDVIGDPADRIEDVAPATTAADALVS